MAKRKRPPPLSYSEKYKQIKKSKFNVDIPKPTDAKSKAMVTRYHKILFGGKKRNGKHQYGLVQSFQPITNKKYVNTLKNVYGKKGSPRIKAGYYPKNLGTVESVSKNFITFKTKVGKVQVLNVNPKEIAAASTERKLELLKPLQGKTTQMMIGRFLQPISFEDYEDLEAAYQEIEDAYEGVTVSFVVT